MTLDELMEQADDLGRHLAVRAEIRSPGLLLSDGTKITPIMFQIESGADLAAGAREILAERPEIVVAALVMEGWWTEMQPGDPVWERIVAGKLAIHELPASERSDVLVLLGETRAGAESARMYRIRPPRWWFGKRRVASESEPMEAWARGWLCFRPMFLERHIAPSDPSAH